MSDLFDYAAQARRGDPPTSHAAALTIKPGTLRARVLDALSDGPKSEHEVASILSKERVSVSPRFAELRDAGLIRQAGTKVHAATNKECICWERIAS